MLDPFPEKVLLKAPEVARMLSMDGKTFARLRQSEPTFPRPIMLGRAGKGHRIGTRLRWHKVEVLLWIASQERTDRDEDEVEEEPPVHGNSGNKGK